MENLAVLIHTIVAKDGELTAQILSNAGLKCRLSLSALEMSQNLDEAGALILSVESLLEPGLDQLRNALLAQPAWSAVPVILVTSGSRSAMESNQRLESISSFFPNATLLERPLRLATLITVVKAVFAARRKQYELKTLLEDLKGAKKEADSASEAKSSFLANMSHEIRTPLSAIMGFADILKSGQLSAEDQAQYLDIIVKNGQALTKILDDILDLSKVEAGKLDIEMRPFHLWGLMEEVLNLLVQRASSKNIFLQFSVPSEMPHTVKSDPVRIRQILINIIGNAIKFTSQGGVTIRVGIEPRQKGQALVSIEVADTGTGLTEEQASRLFQPFSQAESATARKFGGTGLGLLLSRRLARALGGDVVIKSCRLGEGCVFLITFLCGTEVEGVPTLPLKKSQDTPKERLRGRKILVVDDAPDNRALMRILLKKEGAVVEIAESGPEALHRIEEVKDLDAVLMDLQMPGMDGFEVLKEMQHRDYAKPVIALTAHAMAEERAKTQRAGFCDHVCKPVNVNEVVKALLKSFPPA